MASKENMAYLENMTEEEKDNYYMSIRHKSETKYLETYKLYRKKWQDMNLLIHKSFSNINAKENEYVNNLYYIEE